MKEIIYIYICQSPIAALFTTLQGDCRAATLLEVRRLIGLIAVTLHETLYHDNQESEYKGRYQYRGHPS